MKRKAFTLVELLVVVGILAVLAVFLLACLAKGGERGRRLQCVGNMKQIGLALGLYREDNDEHFPRAYMTDDVGIRNLHPALMEAINESVADKRVWQCPSDTGETDPQDPNGYHERTQPLYQLATSSYDWPGIKFPGKSLAGRSIDVVARPEATPELFDSRPWHRSYSPKAAHWMYDATSTYNVLYCDGHVAMRTAEQWLPEAHNSSR